MQRASRHGVTGCWRVSRAPRGTGCQHGVMWGSQGTMEHQQGVTGCHRVSQLRPSGAVPVVPAAMTVCVASCVGQYLQVAVSQNLVRQRVTVGTRMNGKRSWGALLFMGLQHPGWGCELPRFPWAKNVLGAGREQ